MQESRTYLERLQDEVEKQGGFAINFFWNIIIFCSIICVIALLYNAGLTGASMLLYKLLSVLTILVVTVLVVIGYMFLINTLIKKLKPRQELRRLKFKQELKEEILKELNGRRKK